MKTKTLTMEQFVKAGREGRFYIVDSKNEAIVISEFEEDMFLEFEDYEEYNEGLGNLLKDALNLCIKNNPSLYEDVDMDSLEFLTLIGEDTIENNMKLFELINSSNEYKVVAFVGYVNIIEEDLFYNSSENKFMTIDTSGIHMGEKIVFNEIDIDLEFDLNSIELFC